ncbi:sodium- and chloride-dependent glycine transporter 1-like isoform X2 [Strongylocentrotus purpuratus]|uniref:Transporter n=1 Tax=Strongylocentrotus purpuratus TaxID=7668 RepID=A0A7M7NH78_STRPU|nr:sodium- and chloride-dependent glycine transporter 1-like isoform X2 [Strongylocentrotus purpuratus]
MSNGKEMEEVKYDLSKSAEKTVDGSCPEKEVKATVKREHWSNKMDFILSCLGWAVGLGNVWRFPYLCYRNGGGAFLVPYFLMLALSGLPLFLMELGLGQFASRGVIQIWCMAPAFKGIGLTMCMINSLVNIYYPVIIAYIFYYFFVSFARELPWKYCNPLWASENCTDPDSRSNSNGTFNGTFNGTGEYDVSTWSMTTMLPNSTNATNAIEYAKRPAQEFWDNFVLQRSSGLHDTGVIRWQLLLCLALVWILTFLALVKGVKSVGKVVYFTATFPYIVLTILLIRGLTLEGSLDGILYYIRPNFSRLKDPRVWKDAAAQIFYSLGPSWGGLLTMASYNKFNNNFYRDGIIIALLNCSTSIFAGFVIFSVVGFMSFDSGLPIDKVATSGPGLVFVVYPEALARMPFAPLWSVLFFFMFITIGLDSQFVDVETVVSGLYDIVEENIPYMRGRKTLLTGIISFVTFLIGILLVTQSGIYWLTLIDNFASTFTTLVVAVSECLVISYVYGAGRFVEDLKVMLGYRIPVYWQIAWMFIAPFVIVFIFIFFCVVYQPLIYDASYTYRYPFTLISFLFLCSSFSSSSAWFTNP